MQELDGKIAVVTGGASGIGLALARAFLGEGMQVVVADVEQGALDRATAELGDGVTGVLTDVSKPESVEALADATFSRHGACHVLCNNAGVGPPAANVWETTVNDWRWVHGVNVLGVVHGILAFVPRMLEGGQDGYVVNTSSGDGGIAPMPQASVYASSKAAVTSLTECLATQLVSEGTRLRAGIFYPSGGLLRTGLWTADRNRPDELARERPRPTEAMTIDKLEQMAKAGGHELKFQDLDDLARVVVDGVRNDRFIMMVDVASIGPTMRERAAALEQGQLPGAHASLLG
ncbi:MAG: SDR family NAD(P)-dependent oxidoreductase [Acidimicrobiia bacterium]|jgi:NAD(P)-dependent dehydrogenase (short-subunit alcohol dehydrogenase family)